MKTILASAYAVNPYRGSEDAMGWNMILQVARHNNVIAVTRKNNRVPIEKYISQHPEAAELFSRIWFVYFDWPSWTIAWKKGPLLSMLYYYLWQLSLALWLKVKVSRWEIDIVHNLNFHNDWTPTFLWILGKPLVWGHVGHHPKIPKQYLLQVYGRKEYIKDRLLWIIKNTAWRFDPFLWICKRKAAKIICMHSGAVRSLRLTGNYLIHPSVAAEQSAQKAVSGDQFRLLSIGRFVPLKGFDLAIRGFAAFYHALTAEEQARVKLTLIGTGPKRLLMEELLKEEQIEDAVEIIEWMPREELAGHYRHASAFLFPSHEGAGMVVAEAMSYGLPVICLRNCGPGELVHPSSRLAVKPGSYQETVEIIAVRLMLLFKHSDSMELEKFLAADRYEQLFHWDVRGDMLSNVYNELSNNQHTNSPLKTAS